MIAAPGAVKMGDDVVGAQSQSGVSGLRFDCLRDHALNRKETASMHMYIEAGWHRAERCIVAR
jgi:hypothetical protein